MRDGAATGARRGTPLRSEVADARFFGRVGYSTVWEDERVVSEGLRPAAGDRVLSVSSGGCFSLQFLLFDVAEVLSVDFSAHQTALLQLKAAWARVLEHDELWEALGLRPSRQRWPLYERVRGELAPEVRGYWDERGGALGRGVGLCGRQDAYLHRLGRFIGWLQGRATVERLLACGSLAEQQLFYDHAWSSFAWRRFCDVAFSRWVLDRAFDRRHFTYAAEAHPALSFRRASEHVLREVPVQDNFYLHYLFRRSYPSAESCPAWLRRSSFETLRSRLDRLRPLTAELETLLFGLESDSLDCFNFSNVFDWISKSAFVRLMRQVVRVARPRARLCYWTNLVNARRPLPSHDCPQLVEQAALGRSLLARCRTPGYSSCVVAEVVK